MLNLLFRVKYGLSNLLFRDFTLCIIKLNSFLIAHRIRFVVIFPPTSKYFFTNKILFPPAKCFISMDLDAFPVSML